LAIRVFPFGFEALVDSKEEIIGLKGEEEGSEEYLERDIVEYNLSIGQYTSIESLRSSLLVPSYSIRRTNESRESA
jgi:hypothetical protein